MTAAIKLFKESVQPELLDQLPSKTTFKIKNDLNWEIICSDGDYEESSKEILRNVLLGLLCGECTQVRFDLKNITSIDITFLNAVICFAEAHKEIFSEGCLEMINVSEGIMGLFKIVDLTKLYNFPTNKE
ncbi:MAG: hypothetical protein COA79_07730 [Planctomycetota bacterium]|nr:MAG: hypothetical protein COA79_07730 [Planctomycetota bacterium]